MNWLGSERIKQEFPPQLNVEDERFLTKVDLNNCSFGFETHSRKQPGREVYKDRHKVYQ